MKKMILIILFVAELSSWATREYMVQTAQPDKPCTITWSCDVHEYKQEVRKYERLYKIYELRTFYND